MKNQLNSREIDQPSKVVDPVWYEIISTEGEQALQ
jgi:hypothetical protein